MDVEIGAGWRGCRRWSGDGSGTRSGDRQGSCVRRVQVLSARRTTRQYMDRAVPAADSDRAVGWFPAPEEGSEVYCLCRERELVLRKAMRRPDSKPTLRPTASLARASCPRWPSRALCGSWTRSAPPHPPTAGQCYAYPPLRANGLSSSSADPGPSVRAAKRLDESREQPGRERQEIRYARRDQRRRCGSLMVEPEGRGCRLDWNRKYSNNVDSVRSPSTTSPL